MIVFSVDESKREARSAQQLIQCRVPNERRGFLHDIVIRLAARVHTAQVERGFQKKLIRGKVVRPRLGRNGAKIHVAGLFGHSAKKIAATNHNCDLNA